MHTRRLAILGMLAAGLLTAIACDLSEGGIQTSFDGGGGDVKDEPPEKDAQAASDADASDFDATPDAGDDAGPPGPGVLDAGLLVWLRDNIDVSDAGKSDGGGLATAWRDQSSHGNDCIANGVPPKYLANDPAFGGRPTLDFAVGAGLTGAGIVAAQPFTVLVVGNAVKVAIGNAVFFDSLGSGSARNALFATSTAAQLVFYTGGNSASWSIAKDVSSPTVIVAVFDASNSVAYVSSNTGVTGATLDTSTLSGLLVGGNGGSPSGRIAEFALWAGALNAMSAKALNAYASARYGITVAP